MEETFGERQNDMMPVSWTTESHIFIRACALLFGKYDYMYKELLRS